MQFDDWSDYQAFLAITQAGQLGGAGKLLKVDPTTIGRRLRRLEMRLGQTLFEQTREGQILTEAGERLLSNVEKMAAAANQISSTNQNSGGLSGTLRISVPEGFGTWFLTRHLKAFSELHPDLVVDLVANSSYLSLSKREADVAVFLSRPKAGPLVARRLTDYALKLYASSDYVSQKGMPQTPDELSDHILVGYIPDLLYAPELRYLDEIREGLTAHIRSSSISAQAKLLSEGAGIGVLPCFIGDRDRALTRILPDQRLVRSLWLVMHKDTHQLAKIRAFNAWLRNVVTASRETLIGN